MVSAMTLREELGSKTIYAEIDHILVVAKLKEVSGPNIVFAGASDIVLKQRKDCLA